MLLLSHKTAVIIVLTSDKFIKIVISYKILKCNKSYQTYKIQIPTSH